MVPRVMTERAERYLLQLLSSHASCPALALPHGLEPELVEQQQSEGFAAAVDAFVAVGVLPVDAAEGWRQRWGVDEPWGVAGRGELTGDRGLRERAALLLEARLGAIPPPDGELTEEHAQRIRAPMRDFQTVYTTAAVCGAIGSDEGARWQERLRRRIGVPENLERAQRAAFTELLRVVPGPPQRRAGVRITTIELYADGVGMRWHLVRPKPAPVPHEVVGEERDRAFREFADAFRVEVELADDAETAYVATGGGSGGVGQSPDVLTVIGSALFAPALPRNARQLHVRAGGEAFVIEVGS